jgi:hypothetical protein
MPSPLFIILVSIASRLIWSRKYPFGEFRYETNFMALIVLFNVLWFAFCAYFLGTVFP